MTLVRTLVSMIAIILLIWMNETHAETKPYYDSNSSFIEIITHHFVLDGSSVRDARLRPTDNEEVVLVLEIEQKLFEELARAIDWENRRITVSLFGSVVYAGLEISGFHNNQLIIYPVSESIRARAIDAWGTKD